MTSAKIQLFILAIISLLAFLAYKPSFNGDFYHDDLPNLVQNEKVQITDLTLKELKNASLSSQSGKLKRPISMVSFALNYYYFGNQPYSFKAINFIIHIILGFLIFLLVYLIKYSFDKNKNTASWFALIVATIWLIHPLNVSTVAYIIQRMAMLSSLFGVLTISFYLLSRLYVEKHNKFPLFTLLACAGCFLLSIFSKENGILILGLIALLEVFLFSFKNPRFLKTKFFYYLVITGFSLSAILAILYYSDFKAFIDRGYLNREFSLTERLLTESRIIIMYLKWIVFPNITELGIFHDDITISKSLFNPLSTIFSIAIILSLLLSAIIVRRSYPIISIGILWFFIGHLLESTVIPLELAYEHRNYLPAIGIIIVGVELVHRVLSKTNQKSILIAIVCIYCTFLLVNTFYRASQWTTNLHLSHYETQNHPNSARANFSLGRIYANITLQGNKSYRELAIKHMQKAGLLDKSGIIPETSLIVFLSNLKEPANPVWYSRIIEKLQIYPITYSDLAALKQLSLCKTKNSCFLPADDFEQIMEFAFTSPNINNATNKRAGLLTLRAEFLANRKNNFEDAERDMLDAINSAPNKLQYYINYITLLISNNKTIEANKYISILEAKDRFGVMTEKIAKLKILSTKNS